MHPSIVYHVHYNNGHGTIYRRNNDASVTSTQSGPFTLDELLALARTEDVDERAFLVDFSDLSHDETLAALRACPIPTARLDSGKIRKWGPEILDWDDDGDEGNAKPLDYASPDVVATIAGRHGANIVNLNTGLIDDPHPRS